MHEAALTHLARYSTTQAGLLRVLDRRIARWAAAVEGADPAPARAAARRVVARLAESGAVNDAAYAEAKFRSLSRAGKSGRAIGAKLGAKGVAPALSAALLKDEEDGTRETAAAAMHARRRRLGPFRVAEGSPEQRRREMGAMARAGFSGAVAASVLRMSRAEAEAAIEAFLRAQA